MSMPIGATPPTGFAHGHSHAHGLGRQESPAWQARAADPTAKGSAFGALVSQIAGGNTDGSTPPAVTSTGAPTDTSGVTGATTVPPTTTAAGSTTPPPTDPTTTSASSTTDPASNTPPPGSTLNVQV